MYVRVASEKHTPCCVLIVRAWWKYTHKSISPNYIHRICFSSQTTLKNCTCNLYSCTIHTHVCINYKTHTHTHSNNSQQQYSNCSSDLVVARRDYFTTNSKSITSGLCIQTIPNNFTPPNHFTSFINIYYFKLTTSGNVYRDITSMWNHCIRNMSVEISQLLPWT